jgi:hypothetical protein
MLVLGLAAPAARADTLHFYSYDPSDAATRAAAGPVTLQLRKGLMHTTIVALRSTEAQAAADLKPAADRTLGPHGLAEVAGLGPGEHELYQIEPTEQGGALVSALCPGATRGWMAFGRVRLDQDLTITVIGQAPGKAPELCHVLAYSFHGEWRLPPSGPVIRERDLPHGRYPGT